MGAVAWVRCQPRAAVNASDNQTPTLLGPVAIRELAAQLGVSPTKKLGQNFLHDAGTVRRIVAASGVKSGEVVVEVGPGLGSLTLGLLEAGAHVCAVEIDTTLAQALPRTVQERLPQAHLRVYDGDALEVASWEQIGGDWPSARRMIANLPYNVAVPILLHFLALLPDLESVLVMVQAEVADRLTASPGSRTYGVPSLKAAWYGECRRAGAIGRNVFWPAPNVDSALVDLRVSATKRGSGQLRAVTFKLIDVAFEQRRKMLRGALRQWITDAEVVNELLGRAEIDPTRRGETLTIDEFTLLGRCALEMAPNSAVLAGAVDEVQEGYRNA